MHKINNFSLKYAAAIDRAALFSLQNQYPLNLALAAHNKNSSIADLRLKAKR